MASPSSRPLEEYLESMAGVAFTRLYQQPSTVLAVFRRILSHLAKTFVMSMLFLSHPISPSDLDSWMKPGCRKEKDQAVNLLEKLRIFRSIVEPGKPRCYGLTSPFKHSLQAALTGGGDHLSFGVPCDTSTVSGRPSIERLDFYARTQWDEILGYMVGNAATPSSVPGSPAMHIAAGVKKILIHAQLITRRNNAGGATITQDGFAFVLQDINAQVWTILIHYLGIAPDINMDEIEVLSFLFMLGSLELGQDYSKTNLTATQIHMLDDLADFGLIYQTSSTSNRFYPTRLATTLLTSDAGGRSNSKSSKDSQEYILIETNYRLYAYTSSPLQIAILQLFTRVDARYPNMVACRITRESIRKAVDMGITADQILAFLGTHAHPQMQKRVPVLPPTVVDQIKLWQIENERMKATPGFLVKDFSSQEEYRAACEYARDLAILAWSNNEMRMFFVTRIEQMLAYFNKTKAVSEKNSTITAGIITAAGSSSIRR